MLLGVALMGAVGVLVIQVRRPQRHGRSGSVYRLVLRTSGYLTGDAFTGGAPSFAVAPDGRNMAVVAFSQGLSSLWVRSITMPPWRRLEGTEGASSPFWSPDSQSIGFFASESFHRG